MQAETFNLVLNGLIFLPFIGAASTALMLAWNNKSSEEIVSRLTMAILWATFLVAVLLGLFYRGSLESSGYRYDVLTAVFNSVTAFVTALTASFARRYLRHDAGFTRFHCLLLALTGGSVLAFSTSDSLELIAGWECVGICSFLLVAYFFKRTRPREHALLVFACYRVGDAALVLACAMVPVAAATRSETNIGIAGLAILVAAACKSALLPFSFWLPRAMEGPTPSSAVFYGGVSIHLGCYLLLRTEPLWAVIPMMRVAIIGLGGLTLLHSWLAGRTSNDVKTELAYGTISHMGIVFIEIGLGFTGFALLHVASHTLIRTPQYLLASSALRDFLVERRSGDLTHRSDGWENRLPAKLRWQIYRYGFTRGNLEGWISLLVAGPFKFLVELCIRIEGLLESLVGIHLEAVTGSRDSNLNNSEDVRA